MVNSSSFDAANNNAAGGERNGAGAKVVARSGQGHEAPQSGSPVTAATATSSADNTIETNADGDVTMSIHANCDPNETNDNNAVCCSLPLEKIHGLLPSDNSPQTKSKPKLLCLFCDRSFGSANLRQKHVERIHSAKQNRRISGRRQNMSSTPCIHCDKMSNAEHTLNELFKHMVHEHPSKYFGCLPCEDRFITQVHLSDHNSVNHPSTTDSPLPPIELVIPENSIPPQKVTRSRLKPKQEDPLNLPDEDEFKKPADVKKKRTNVKDKDKTSRVVVKRSKRLQAQLKEVESDKRRTRRGQKLAEPEQTSNSTKSPDKSKPAVSINPYAEFDTYYRIKKITDHSIDNLKISSLTFDDVFDKAFFNRIKCNIEDNLLHHIDGKLFKNEESESRISNFEKVGSQSVQNLENYGCELTLNAITPVAALSLNSQYGEDFESQIEYGSKPSKKKTTPVKKDEIHYKYFTRRKYQASILEQKENRDLSRLDMWTQLVIKERQQKIINDKKSAKEILEYTSGEEYKSKIKREELDRILDRRGPFEDLKEEISKKAAFDKLNSTSENAVSAEVFTVVREVVNDLLARVLDGSEDEPTPATADNKPDDRLVPAFLNLRPTSSLPEEEIDKSDRIALICSSQETENFELPTNKARRKDEKIELTGEWARSRIYICAACGDKFPNLKYLLEHKSLYHPNVWVQHYEFVGNQSALYRHLAIPGLGKMGVVEEVPQCKQWRRSEARLCAKCRKQCNSLGELHRHLLECGGDWTWILARKKCKYRPFGAKSRRKRRLLTRIQRKEKTDSTDTEKKIYKKTYYNGPRSKPSDAETIQRMLANLPAKRSRRSFVSLRDVIFKSRKRNTTPQTQESSSDKNVSLNKPKSKQNQRSVNMPSSRRTLRSINKVLSSTILDSSLLRVKRKMKINEQRTTRHGRKRTENQKESVTESAEENTKSKKTVKNKEPLIVSNTNMQNKIARKRILNSRLNIKNFFPVKKRNSRRTEDTEVIVNPSSIRSSRNIPSIEEIKETRQGGGLKGLVRNLRKKNSSPTEDKITTSPSRRPKLTRQQSKESISSEKSTGKNSKKEEKKKEKAEENVALETSPLSVKERVANKIKDKRCLKKIKPLEEKTVDAKPKNKNLKKKFQTIINNVKNLTLETNTDAQSLENVVPTETPVNPHAIFLEKGILQKAECSMKTKEPLMLLEAKEEGVMKESSVHVVTNLMDSKENPPIPEKMFNLEPGNEEQLQAKGELNFDKKIDFPSSPSCKKSTPTAGATTLLSINVDMPEKPKNLISPTLISPSLKGKIRKPAKGLNDCIAMLTSKLQQKLSPSLPVDLVPNTKVPDKVEEKPVEPLPSPKLPILRIPTFKVTTPTDETNETALDLSKKSTEKANVINNPDNTSVYFEPPKELQLSEFGSTLNKVIGDVIEHKCKEVLSEKLTSHGWTSVNDIIQKVINSESKNLTRKSPAPIFPKNNVDDSIEAVIRRYSLETTEINDLFNKSKKGRSKTSYKRRANSEKDLLKSSEITLTSLLQDGDAMSRSLQNIPYILSPPILKRDEVIQKEIPVSSSVGTLQKRSEIESEKPVSPPKNEPIQKVIEITSTSTSRGDPVQKVLEISTIPVADDYDELDIERLIPETKLQKIIPGQEPSLIKTDQNFLNLPVSNVISLKNSQDAQLKTDWLDNSKASLTLENEFLNVNKTQVSNKPNELCLQPVSADKELLSQIDAVLSKANNLVDIDNKKPKPKRKPSRRKKELEPNTNDTSELGTVTDLEKSSDFSPAESNVKRSRGRRKKEPKLESKGDSNVPEILNNTENSGISSKNVSETVTDLEISSDLPPTDSFIKKGRGRKKKESLEPKANSEVFETQNNTADLDSSLENPVETVTDLEKQYNLSPTNSNLKKCRGRKKKESKLKSTNSGVLDIQNNTINKEDTVANLEESADLPSTDVNFKRSLGRKKKETQMESKTSSESLELQNNTMDLDTNSKNLTETFADLKNSSDIPVTDSNIRTGRGRRKKESQLETEVNSKNNLVESDTSPKNLSETFESSTSLPTTDGNFKNNNRSRRKKNSKLESKANSEVLETENNSDTSSKNLENTFNDDKTSDRLSPTETGDDIDKLADIPSSGRTRGSKKKESQLKPKSCSEIFKTQTCSLELNSSLLNHTETVTDGQRSANLPTTDINIKKGDGRKKKEAKFEPKLNSEVLQTQNDTVELDTSSKDLPNTVTDLENLADHLVSPDTDYKKGRSLRTEESEIKLKTNSENLEVQGNAVALDTSAKVYPEISTDVKPIDSINESSLLASDPEDEIPLVKLTKQHSNNIDNSIPTSEEKENPVLLENTDNPAVTTPAIPIIVNKPTVVNPRNKSRKKNIFVSKTFMKRSKKKKSNVAKNRLVKNMVLGSIASASADNAVIIEQDQSYISGKGDQVVSPSSKEKSVTEPLDASTPISTSKSHTRRKSKTIKKIDKVDAELFKDFALVINKKTKRIPPTNIIDDSVCDEEETLISSVETTKNKSSGSDDAQEDMELEEIPLSSAIIERSSIVDIPADSVEQSLCEDLPATGMSENETIGFKVISAEDTVGSIITTKKDKGRKARPGKKVENISCDDENPEETPTVNKEENSEEITRLKLKENTENKEETKHVEDFEVVSVDDTVGSKITKKNGKGRKIKPGKKTKNILLNAETTKEIPTDNMEENLAQIISLEFKENTNNKNSFATENKDETKHVEDVIQPGSKNLELRPTLPKRRGRKPRSTQNSLSETLDQAPLDVKTSITDKIATNESVKDILSSDLCEEVKNKVFEDDKEASQIVMPAEENMVTPNTIIEPIKRKSQRREKFNSTKEDFPELKSANEIYTFDEATIESSISSENVLSVSTSGTKKRKSRYLKKDLEPISSPTKDVGTKPFESTKEPFKEASSEAKLINEMGHSNTDEMGHSNTDESTEPLPKQFRSRRGRKLKKDILNVEQEENSTTKQERSMEVAEDSIGVINTTEEIKSFMSSKENLLDLSVSNNQSKNRKGRNSKKSIEIITEPIKLSTESVVLDPPHDVINTHSEFDFQPEENEPLESNKRKVRKTRKDIQSASDITKVSIEPLGFEEISDDLIGNLKTRRSGKNLNLNKEKQPPGSIELQSSFKDRSVQEDIVASTNLNILPEKNENFKSLKNSAIKISSPERKSRGRKPRAVNEILTDKIVEDKLEGDLRLTENSNVSDQVHLDRDDKSQRFYDDLIPETQFNEQNNRKGNKRKSEKSKSDLEENLTLDKFEKPLELHDNFRGSPLGTKIESSTKSKKPEGLSDSRHDDHASETYLENESNLSLKINKVKRKDKKEKYDKPVQSLFLDKFEKSKVSDAPVNSSLDPVIESSDKTADPALDCQELANSQLHQQSSLDFKIPENKVKRKGKKIKYKHKENLMFSEPTNLVETPNAPVNTPESDSLLDNQQTTERRVYERSNIDLKLISAKVKRKGRKTKPKSEDMLLVESNKSLEILNTSVNNLFNSVPYVELLNDLSLSLREHQADKEINNDFEKMIIENKTLEEPILTSPKTKRRGRPVKIRDEEKLESSNITEVTENLFEDTKESNEKKSRTGPTICDIILNKIQQGKFTNNSDQLMNKISNINDFTPKDPEYHKENLTDSGLSSSENVSPIPRRRSNKTNVSLENSITNIMEESQQQDGTPKSKRKSRKSELDHLKAIYHLESNTSSSTPLQESGLGEDSSISPEEKDTNMEPKFVIPELTRKSKKLKKINIYMQENSDNCPNGLLTSLTKEEMLTDMDNSPTEESKIRKDDNISTVTLEKRQKSPAKANKKIDITNSVTELDKIDSSTIETKLNMESKANKEANISISFQQKTQKSPKTNKKNEKLNSLSEYEPVIYKNIFEEIVEKPSRTRSKSKAILAEQTTTLKSESFKNKSIYDFVEESPQVCEEHKTLVEKVAEHPLDDPVEVLEKPIKTKNKIDLPLEPPIYKNIFEIEEKPTRTRNKSKGILEDKPASELIKEGTGIKECDTDECLKSRKKSKGSIESIEESDTLIKTTEKQDIENLSNVTNIEVKKKGRKKSKTNLSDALDVATITQTADQQKSEELDVFEFQPDEIAPVSKLKRSRKKSLNADIADGLLNSPDRQSTVPLIDALLKISGEMDEAFEKRPTRGRKKSPQKKTNKRLETDLNQSGPKEPLFISNSLLITRTEISDSDLDKQADEEVASLTCKNWDSLVPTDLDESRQSSLSDKAPSLIGARSPSLSPPPEKQEAPKVIDIVPVLNESSDIFDQIKKKPTGAGGSFDIFDSLKGPLTDKPILLRENPEPIVEVREEPKVPKLSMRELKKSKGLLVDEPTPVFKKFIPHINAIHNDTPEENNVQEKNEIEQNSILNSQIKIKPQDIFEEEKSIVRDKSKQNKKHTKKNKVAKVRENVLKLFNSNSNLDFDTLKSKLEKITKPVMKNKLKSNDFVAEIEPLTEILTSSYMDIAPVIDEIDKSLEMDDVYDFEDEHDMPTTKQKKGTQYEKKLEPTRRTSNRTAKAKALEHIHDEALSQLLDDGLGSVKLDIRTFESDLNKKIPKKPKSKKIAECNQVEDLNRSENNEDLIAVSEDKLNDLTEIDMPEKKTKNRRSKSLSLKEKEFGDIEGKVEKLQSPILDNQESFTSQKIDDMFLPQCNSTKILEPEKDNSLINATLSHESNSEETLWNKMFAAAKTLKSPDKNSDSLENLPDISEEIQENSFFLNSNVEKLPDALKVSSENLQNKEIELPVVEKSVKKKPGRKSKKEKELLEQSLTKEFELIENNPDLVESLKENQIAIAEKQINSLNEEKIDNGEIRRSRRGTQKIISYNENDLIDPVIEAYEKKRKSLYLKKDKPIDQNLLEVFGNLTTIESIKANPNVEVNSTDASKDVLVDKIYEFTDSPENDDNFGKSISTLRKNKTKPQKTVTEIEESDIAEVKTDKVDKFKTPASSVYCEICKKTFQRIENLIKHKTTLTHISKLSELEAIEAELRNKQKELEDQQQLPKSNEEINISGILEAEKPVSDKGQTSFSNNDTLKLADIISEVLNKPTQDSKTKDYDSESDSELETLKLKAKENYSSTLTKTIAEKQISLLENIIEKTSGNLLGRIFDAEPLNHEESEDELPEVDVDVSSAYKDNSMVYDHSQILKPPSNTFAKPDQYEEISEDSTSLSNFDDQKSRKILNRDEELFLECCSLLKSGSEVSNFSKKDKRSEIMGTRQLVQPEEEAHEFSDNSRTPTPLGDTFDDDASGSNSIASEWNPQPVDKVGKNFTFKEAWMEEPLLAISQREEVNVQDQEDTGEKDIGIEDRLDSGGSSPSLKVCDPEIDNQAELQEILPIENKKIITKGARKVFEGLKISIPTEDLDLDIINHCQNKDRNDEVIETSAKSKGRKSKPTKKSQVGSNVLFKANKKKSPVLPASNNDVYDFQSTQAVEVFTKPNFEVFKSQKYDKDEETDNFDDSNGAEAELASNVSNSSYSLLSTKKSSPPLPIQENITKKKSKAMSKIFKNAAKSRLDEIEAEMRDIPEIPEIDNIELVENYVLSCSQMSDREPSPPSDREEIQKALTDNKPSKMTEQEMDKLFDQLIGKKIEEKSKPKIKSPPKAKSDNNTKKSEVNIKKSDVKNGETKVKKQTKQKGRKRARSDSETDDEFNLNQKKQYRKKKEEDNVIDLEKELRECIGVASRKSQRSCTSGKQNVLVEYWSSDDEAFEKMLQAQNVKKPTKPKASTKKSLSKEEILSREIEKTLDSASNSAINDDKDKTDDKSVEEDNGRLKAERKKPGRKKKTVNIEADASKDDDMDEKTELNSNSVTASSRRKRVASNPLYHWSSSSEDDEPESMVEITSIRDEEEDDRPVQHGWIVGDSPKKLVTMLALIKGKKADSGDSVKEQNKKRTGSTGSAAVS